MISDDHWYSRGLVPKSGITVRVSLGVIYIIVFLALTDRLFNLSLYNYISGEWDPMMFITMICFILSGLASFLIYTDTPSVIKKRSSVILAFLVIVVALISLGVYIFTLKTGTVPSISEIPVLNLFLMPGNRMALLTAILFLLSGIILLLLQFKKKWTDNLAHIVVLPVAMISYFILVTYIFDAEYIHEKAGTAVAPATGMAFCALSVVLMFLRTPDWLMKILSIKTMGGIIVRRLIPVLLLLPLIIGLIRTGSEEYGLINSGAGAAFITLTYTFCFVIVLWFTARTVNRIEEIRYNERTSELITLNKELNNEIKERIKAEKTVDSERKRFNDVLELMPAYIILLKDDYRIPYANRYFRERFGESNGKRCYEYLFNRTEPCEICETYTVLKENKTITWEWTGPDTRRYSIFDFPFTDADGSKMIMEVGIDITDLKNAEEDLKKLNAELEQRVNDRTLEVRESENRYRTMAIEQKSALEKLFKLNRTLNSLGKSSQAMMHSKDEQHYLAEVCRIIIEDCGHKMVWIGYALDDREKSVIPVAFTGFEEGYLDTLRLTWSDTELGRGPTGTAIRTGKPAVCTNMQTDPSFEPWRNEAVKRGYASSVVLPIINEGKTIGALSIYSTEIEPFSEEEINLLSEIADDMAYGITNLRLLESEKKAIEAIKESEEKYRQLFDSMSEGFALHEIITDNNGKPCDYRFISLNPAFEKLTGLNAQNLIGKRVTEALPGTEMYWIEAYGKVALNGISLEFENYHAGLNKHFRVKAFCPQKGYFASIFEDISIRMKAEKERIIAQEQMRLSGEKLDLALENGNIGTWEWDLETNIISMDNRMELIFGIEPGSFEGTYDAFTRYLSEEDIPHVNKAVTETLDLGVPFDTVYRRKLKDGSMNYISAKASVVKNSIGKPVKMSGVCFDITDMKEGAEKTLFKLNEDLLRSNRELEQFAYVASHDLQEPLRMVSSFTQLLSHRYGDKLDKDAQEFIGFAVDGAMRMQNLINDLLEFSRIETKGRKFKRFDINKAFFQATDNLKLKINELDAQVSSDNLPGLLADESQMVLLFQNLIGNAIKFSKKKPKVHVSCIEKDDCYLFSVKDNGIGIDAQYFTRIFNIFQRLHAKNEYGGTGIGLAICKRIVEGHGGKIWVESMPGKGSVFYFTLLKRA